MFNILKRQKVLIYCGNYILLLLLTIASPLSVLQNMGAIKEWVFNSISQRRGSVFWYRTAGINQKMKKKKKKNELVCVLCCAVLSCSRIWESFGRITYSYPTTHKSFLFLFAVTLNIGNINCVCLSENYLEISRTNECVFSKMNTSDLCRLI